MAGTKRKRGGKKGGRRARRSRYVGVSWKKDMQKWYAQITARGVQQYLGYFHDEADGARAYDAAVAAQNLRYARNFPGPSPKFERMTSRFTSSSAQIAARRSSVSDVAGDAMSVRWRRRPSRAR